MIIIITKTKHKNKNDYYFKSNTKLKYYFYIYIFFFLCVYEMYKFNTFSPVVIIYYKRNKTKKFFFA